MHKAYLFLLSLVTALVLAHSSFAGHFAKVPMQQQITWLSSQSQALDQAKAQKKAVLIDFFAEWCLPCKQMEAQTYTDAQVIDYVNQHFVALKIDATDLSQASIKTVFENYGISALPLILFLSPLGQEIKDKRLTGFASKSEFLAHLKSVIQSLNPASEVSAAARPR